MKMTKITKDVGGMSAAFIAARLSAGWLFVGRKCRRYARSGGVSRWYVGDPIWTKVK